MFERGPWDLALRGVTIDLETSEWFPWVYPETLHVGGNSAAACYSCTMLIYDVVPKKQGRGIVPMFSPPIIAPWWRLASTGDICWDGENYPNYCDLRWLNATRITPPDFVCGWCMLISRSYVHSCFVRANIAGTICIKMSVDCSRTTAGMYTFDISYYM